MKWDVRTVQVYGHKQYEVYEELSNGQFLGAFVQKMDDKIFNFAVCILETREECEQWARGRYYCNGISGECGLEGLAKAYKFLKWFVENQLPEGSRMHVHGYDRKGQAYRFVKRLGFVVDYEKESESQYVFVK